MQEWGAVHRHTWPRLLRRDTTEQRGSFVHERGGQDQKVEMTLFGVGNFQSRAAPRTTGHTRSVESELGFYRDGLALLFAIAMAPAIPAAAATVVTITAVLTPEAAAALPPAAAPA